MLAGRPLIEFRPEQHQRHRQTVAFPGVTTRGRGLVHGVVFGDASLAEKVGQAAFDRGLLVETSGWADDVIKLMPPLTITDEEIEHGIQLLTGAMEAVCG
ncbi:hypothetical protein [Nocardia abscessus]|uniref:hypothetical protein n=1 Tax=Nocardia abscessus TaxID=120957 RepID=UPI002456BADF|nr:hypothetical protein [Nocardia abscessus]